MLRRLPSRGIPIGRLAAECCGDAHALDDGRPAGTLVLSAVRALAGLPFAAEGAADSRRAAWAAVGVHLDELSSLVLCLGLPGDTRTALGRTLASCREAGSRRCSRFASSAAMTEPLRVRSGADMREPGGGRGRRRRTGRQVPAAGLRRRPAFRGRVAAAGATRGRRRRSSITTATSTGAASGSPARSCHRVNWRPWRYDHQAYEAAVSAAHPLTPLGSRGEPVATPWDPELAAAMRHRNVRIEEELTLDALLQDLGRLRIWSGCPGQPISSSDPLALRPPRRRQTAADLAADRADYIWRGAVWRFRGDRLRDGRQRCRPRGPGRKSWPG